ncbi:radial spoke head 14 homolog [Bacillus rossius redtenbacheri]|uniref:radial spoke head 14 homolog n=1 Tax=Bacillus rossius redtenbacheri TaxID=93214 RepID=UPI002FDECE4D
MATGRYNYLTASVQSVKPRILSRTFEKVFKYTKDLAGTNPIVVSLPNPEPCTYGPHVDVTQARVAYGRWGIPLLIKDLESEDPDVVSKAINTLADLIHNPEKTFEAIRHNIVEHVAELMLDEEQEVRERCASIVTTIASQGVGREAIIDNEVLIDNLKELMMDDADDVRLRAGEALEMICRSVDGASALLDADILTSILDDLQDEYNDDVMLLLLRTLEHLLGEEHAATEAVGVGVIDVLWQALDHRRPDVVAMTASCVAAVLATAAGKEDAETRDYFMMSVARGLRSQDRNVLTKTITALQFFSVHVQPRKELLDLGVLPKMVQLATNPVDKELQIAAIKVATNLAEVPEGRSYLLRRHITELEHMGGLEDEAVARHAATLVRVIRWKP